ncbi:hypothetical protein CWI38_1035p0020 [Hamiltosporidium tvaerminnensis]|uniref:Uncharacterized protein n=2 Tax=Hamiltosporidium TaxID=1176354 RepID=A0A4Q9LUB4_9MICR|nr:hypothetical protein LUQ84_000891 [Hamiltosporidium tvaerminnensis]TBT98535.1 hypothetical protein CWI37_1712p0010 [Hamiltosporidium tvaerminnensis]TBU00251.1 hypothetical protein CWI36_1699p0010 [Hamiltosporidium magnivora]TBU11796.1 hypothetical protein CWI38_1035p0020 [Hamiltosporidium tvaerminnensis]
MRMENICTKSNKKTMHSAHLLFEKKKKEKFYYVAACKKMNKIIEEQENEIEVEDEDVNKTAEEIIKKRKKTEYKGFLRMPTEEEICQDIEEIHGNKDLIKIFEGVLTIGENEFIKGEKIKINLHGNVFSASIVQIGNTEISIKAKDGTRTKIQLVGLKGKGIKIYKIKQQD